MGRPERSVRPVLGVLSALAATALVATSCGSSTPPGGAAKSASRASGNAGARSAAIAKGSPGTKPGSSSSQAATSSKPSQGRYATPGGGTSTGSVGQGAGSSSTRQAEVAAADHALSSYFAALSSHNASALGSVSTGPAQDYGVVLVDIASIDQKKGATVSTRTSPSFTVSSATPTQVVFGGSGTVTGTVSGPKGSNTSTDTLSGPLVVVRGSSGWLVSSFLVNAKPMVEWVEAQTQSEGGITVEVGSILSYGDITMVLIALGAPSGSSHVVLQSAVLTSPSGSETGTGNFTAPPTPVGVLRFARIGGNPSALALSFSTSSGSTLSYHFGLSAGPTS